MRLPLFLKISTTEASDHAVGSCCVERMLLKRVRRWSLLSAVSHLKVSTGRVSGPGALLFLHTPKILFSSFIVIGLRLTGFGPVIGVLWPVYSWGGGAQWLPDKYRANVSACSNMLTTSPSEFWMAMVLPVKGFLSLLTHFHFSLGQECCAESRSCCLSHVALSFLAAFLMSLCSFACVSVSCCCLAVSLWRISCHVEVDIHGCLGCEVSLATAAVVAAKSAVWICCHCWSSCSCVVAVGWLSLGRGVVWAWKWELKASCASFVSFLTYLGLAGMGGLAPLLIFNVACTSSWFEQRAVEMLVVMLCMVPFHACGQRKWSSWTLCPVGLVWVNTCENCFFCHVCGKHSACSRQSWWRCCELCVGGGCVGACGSGGG